MCKIVQMIVQRKSNPVPFQGGAGDSQRGGRMTKRSKVELVRLEADSDTQRVLERLIVTLERQGFKIMIKEQK